ncbi:hypothetical protein EVAR_47971_1 [Eumeta japonica]|uniref:Uncharacterized protein n=1 Tax=Eumeta variegata TaxID=151549 RepID=A0A4C1X941_EUMVA|nr:hypothetical protein EVAR_47971_1 [Eumeta japonica]
MKNRIKSVTGIEVKNITGIRIESENAIRIDNKNREQNWDWKLLQNGNEKNVLESGRLFIRKQIEDGIENEFGHYSREQNRGQGLGSRQKAEAELWFKRHRDEGIFVMFIRRTTFVPTELWPEAEAPSKEIAGKVEKIVLDYDRVNVESIAETTALTAGIAYTSFTINFIGKKSPQDGGRE